MPSRFGFQCFKKGFFLLLHSYPCPPKPNWTKSYHNKKKTLIKNMNSRKTCQCLVNLLILLPLSVLNTVKCNVGKYCIWERTAKLALWETEAGMFCKEILQFSTFFTGSHSRWSAPLLHTAIVKPCEALTPARIPVEDLPRVRRDRGKTSSVVHNHISQEVSINPWSQWNYLSVKSK